jgi:hypothetical protein
MDRNQILPPSIGTTLKLLITADLGDNIHLEDVDFTCVFFREGLRNGQTIEKQEMTRIDKDEYIAVVDTKIIGTGEYYMKLSVRIPDNDVEGSLRDEVVVVPTNIRVTN